MLFFHQVICTRYWILEYILLSCGICGIHYLSPIIFSTERGLMGSGLGKRLNGEIGESWRHCHAPLQGIFPTQGTNPRLLHWQVDFLPLSHLGSPHSLAT